jgi:hypothetical protein
MICPAATWKKQQSMDFPENMPSSTFLYVLRINYASLALSLVFLE